MTMGLLDFREGKVENWGQNWKNAQFPRSLKGNFYCLSLNGKNTPISPFLPQIPSLTLELNQKTNKKTLFLNKFLNIPSILNLSLPLFLGYIPNLIMPPYVFLIEVWLAKFRFKILSLSEVIEEKPLGRGVATQRI